jgi:cytoskeletal protein CcmA (bactofilin family)
MGFFKKDRAVVDEGAEGADASDVVSEHANPQQVGIVSGVLSEERNADSETPHSDIVERHFGPDRESATSIDPEAPASAEPGAHDAFPGEAFPNERSPGERRDVLLDVSELDSPDLEVDPVAHIGRSTKIIGDITAEEDLEVKGSVEGSMKVGSHRVTISEEGVVKAHVAAKAVVVMGRVDGDIDASEVVEVRSGGHVCGNVRSPRVILQDGAIVIGGLDMSSALPDRSETSHAGEDPPRPSLKKVGVQERDASTQRDGQA